MVLPVQLAKQFYEQLSFYSCTVSNFEQYTLAKFIEQGYFEKHINRMRLHYGRKRNEVLRIIKSIFNETQYNIEENDSGLHFLLEVNTDLSDSELKDMLIKRGVKISAVSDYEMVQDGSDKQHKFIINYSNVNNQRLKAALETFFDCIF